MSAKRQKPEPEVVTDVLCGTPPDPPSSTAEATPVLVLEPYRAAVTSLKEVFQQLADMREVLEHLRGEQARLSIDREKLLTEAETSSEPDVEMLGRLHAKSEILGRKIARISTEIADAEGKAQSEFVTVSASLTSLWNMFRFWFFDAEKERIAALMIAPVPQLALERVVTCFKTVIATRALEPNGGDVASLSRQADALLAAIAATAFRLPDPVATTSVAAAQVVPPIDYNQPLPPLPTGVYSTAEPPDEDDVIYHTL